MHTIRTILAGVDFSDAGQSALNEAALLARTFGARLALLHALPHVRRSERDAPAVMAHAEGLLDKLAADLAQDEVQVARPFLLSTGEAPHDALLAGVAEARADLVVLGMGNKTTLDRVLVGATAERVVREAPRPVWLTRPGKDHARIKRIVVAVDASEPAREALATAAFLARTFVAALDTLAVRPGSDGEVEAADRRFHEALERIDLHGIEHRVVVRDGGVVEGIVQAVHDVGADLLVLGSARRRGLARLAHPNTAERVLREVSCSVLTIPVADAR